MHQRIVGRGGTQGTYRKWYSSSGSPTKTLGCPWLDRFIARFVLGRLNRFIQPVMAPKNTFFTSLSGTVFVISITARIIGRGLP
jgi:hypothetical protein